MASLAEIRQQYPQYQDLSDQQLADGLHRKFYSDMPREEFDQKIGLQPQEPAQPQTTAADLVMNAEAGLNNSIYSTLGAPVDALTWAMNKGVSGINAATGAEIPQIKKPFMGSRSIAGMFGAIGVPDPEEVKANTTAERIARGVGEGIGYTIAPEAAVAGLARAGLASAAPKTADLLGRAFGGATSTGAVAANAGVGGMAGLGATAASEAVPEKYQTLASLTGGLAGAGVGVGMTALPHLGRGLLNTGLDYIAPMTDAGRTRLAAQTLRDSATNPALAREALENIPPDLVAGSKPTTFQLTGDMGLGSLERSMQTKYPDAFMQRRADQNTARVDALRGIQPEGAPERVAQTIKDSLNRLEQDAARSIARARQNAVNEAQGSFGIWSPPEQFGMSMRSAVRAAEDAARAQERQLWSAVDPDGTLTVSAGNTSRAAGEIGGAIRPTEKPMSAEQMAIFNVARDLGNDAVAFADVSALRSRISAEMRREMMENGRSPAYARLSQLRSAVEDDLNGVISQKVAAEAEAVAAGAMREEETIAAAFQSDQASRYARQEAARASSAAGSSGNAGRRPATLSSLLGTEVPTRGGFSYVQGRQGLSGYAGRAIEAPKPATFNFTARERLKAATEATKARAQTFGGNAMLRRQGESGPYNMTDAAVPGRVFVAGPRGGEEVAKFREIVGDGPAMQALEEYAASQVGRVAMTKDGTINLSRLEAFQRQYADALRAFPELNAKFASVSRATKTLEDVTTAANTRLKEYQAGIIQKLVGVDDPADVTRVIGSVFGRQDSAAIMRRLVQETKHDPVAFDGLRKAVSDHIFERFLSTTEAATSGTNALRSDQFIRFARQNYASLGQVFNQTEINTIKALADDIQRSGRSLSAVKIPGQSNTAQDLSAIARDPNTSLLSKIKTTAGKAAATGAGFMLDGSAGGLIGLLGASRVSAMRQAGLTKVDDLIRDAMLDPILAHTLLSKAPVKKDGQLLKQLGSYYRRGASAGMAVSAQIGERGREPLKITVGPR